MISSAIEQHAKARSVRIEDENLIVDLSDGRTISAPLVWFPRLTSANKQQLMNWKILGNGEGIHWPDLDEDLSIAGLLAGTH